MMTGSVRFPTSKNKGIVRTQVRQRANDGTSHRIICQVNTEKRPNVVSEEMVLAPIAVSTDSIRWGLDYTQPAKSCRRLTYLYTTHATVNAAQAVVR